jgi:hypothetical protein
MAGSRYTQSDVIKALVEPGSDLPTFQVSSLGEYCEVADLIRNAWVEKVNKRQRETELKGYVGEILPWFRGVRKVTGMLTPKLAREWIKYKQRKTDVAGLDNLQHRRIYDLEDYYYDRFTRFGRPFIGSLLPMDEIEWNYIMRHHEIPSRLLDWTKGSLIALSYAVQHSLPTRRELNSGDLQDKREPDDAVVWMLEPRRLMEISTQELPHSSSKGIRNIASREPQVRGMRRDFFKDPSRYTEADKPFDKDGYCNYNLWHIANYWKYPLPLIPSHISARVESHLSRFTLHSLDSFRHDRSRDSSKDQASLPAEDESLSQFARITFESDTYWYLVKIELSGADLLSIARVLRMTGVGDMNFTQDLDGLARELQVRAHLGFQDDLA